MFTCLWQLWDWLDPPLFTTATMESKKLQQLQQANSHLAPMPQTKAPSYQMATGGGGGGNDYRQARSPVFHNHPQYQSLASNFAQINLTNHQNPLMGGGAQQAQPQQQQQQHSSDHLHNKNLQNLNTNLLNSSDRLGYATTPQQQQPHSQLSHNLAHYHGEQIYQSNSLERERLYQQPPLRTHYPNSHSHVHPTNRLQQQYQLLQQEKMQQQLKTQNDAYVQQQQTFALRQQLNPPLPSQSHYHMQSQSQTPIHIPAQMQQQQQQQQQQHQQQQQQQQQLQQHQLQSQQLSQQQQLQLQQQQQQHHHSRNIPPSSLNLTTHFQPAPGPIQMKNNKQQQQQQQQQSQYATSNPLHHHAAISQNLLQNARLQQSQAIYQQNQQIQQQIIHKQMQQQSPQTNQIIIQQNNPGQVVNQACQTQIAGVSSSQKSSKGMNSSSSSTPSSTHPPLERKKSEPIHALKSPVTKRHPAAAVTLSGWLYKQGSEGLKVWRKRWFVLADYCLFYYKSQEEEKLLGSVLLPSYRISACLPEDKVVRKYAFKCEHTNMRTYWLAAETAESMIHWVRALTLATMMQGSSESESQPSPLSLNENSDSGIHTFQSQQSKLSVPAGPLTPASDGGNGGGGAGNGGGVQPLYANAPPKPRRATDGGYSSPSPENSIEKYDSHYDVQMQRQQQQQHNLSHQQAKSPIPSSDPIYESRQKNALSAMNEMRQQTMKSPDPSAAMRLQQTRIDNNKSPHVARQNMKSPYPPENLYVQEPMRNGPQSTNPVYPNEQYRGENIIRAPQKFTDDYNQTIYGEKVSDRERELYLQKMMIQQAQAQQLQLQQQQQQQQQQRFTPSMSGSLPFNYQNAERRTPDTYGPPRAGQDRRNFSDYEDIYNLAAQANQPADAGSYRRPMSPVRYNNNTQIPNMPTRYTPNYMEPPTAQHIQMRARPAQSMVPRPHSADFLEYEARNPETTRMRAEPARAPRPKSSLDINRTPDNYYYSEASYAEKMRQSASYLQKQNTMPGKVRADDYSDRLKDGENNNLQSASSSNTIPRESDFERANRLGLNTDDIQGAASVPRVHRPNAKNFPNQQELFLRSASARLPRKDDEPNVRDGERKREESMKRLLEWKQRMLQSPLTRKISQQMPSGAMMSVTAQPTTPTMNLSNKSPVPQKMMSQGGSGGSGVGGIQRSRSETNANTGYNSYSSDDEDGPQLSPAGRSSHIPCTINSNNTNIVTSITTASLTSNLISSHSTNNNNDMIKYPIINPKESIHPAATGNTLNMKSLSTPMTTVPPVPPTKPTTPKPLLPGTPGRSSPGTSGSVSHSLSTETNAPYVPVYKRNLSSFKSAAATSSMLSMQHTTTIPSPVKAFQIVSESAAVVKAADPTIEDDTYDGNVTLTEDVGDVKTTNPPTDLTSDLDSNFGNENDEADEDDEVDDDDKTFEYTDDDLDEALYAENEYEKSKVLDEEPRTPTIVAGDANLEEDISESHYVPMTPKKTPSTSESSIAAMDILNSIRNSSSEIIEENPYIEMTQGTMKSILADDSKSAYEMIMVSNKKADSEPLYMELTQLQNVPDLSLNSMNSNSANSVKTIVSDGKTTIKKSTLKRHSDRNSMKKKARNDLPDILKPSQNNYMRSDSSDADDEASKDFDSMDMKSRTRFSLSDTFRPASYYLGASTPLNECIDSSDSEIVSPPPIPKSPPPMDELKTEEIFSSENYDTVKRREKQMSDGSSFEQIPKVHSSNQSLNMGKTSSPSDGHRSSRLSLQDQMYNKQMPAHKLNSSEYLIGLSKYKMENNDVISGSNYSFNTDDGSNTSSDYDMYNKIKMESPSYSGDSINQSNSSLSQKYQNDSETDSIELRNSEISRLNMEMKKKRRPLSEDSFSEIESMGNFDETISSVNLDQYLNKLESSDLYLYPNTAGTSNEQNNWINNSLTQINEIHFIQPPEVFRTEHDNEIYYENIQLTNQKLENVALMKSKFHIDVSEVHAPSSIRSISALSSNGTYYDSLEDQNDQMKQKAGDANLTSLSMLREKNLSLHDAQCESEDLKVAAVTRISNIEIAESVTMSTVDLDQQSSCTAFDLTQPSPIHSRGNSNVSDSAPYYYSDIASRNSSNQDENPNGSLNSSGGSNSLTQQKLNNQRDVSLKKIAGISHIHNPINKRSQQLQSLQPMQEGHSSQSTSENRTISVDILNVADKDRGIDIRNLYETDRLDKNINKSVETSFTNKIYFNDKFTNHHNSNQMNMNNNCNVNNNRLSGNGNQSAIEGMLINNSLSPIAVKPINTSMESSMFARNSLNNSVHSHNSSNADNISYTSKNSDMSAGDELWEEDAIWSESLRRVSHRHAQSMDDLDRINPGQTMASVTGSTPTPPICLSNSRNSDASDKEWNHHQQQQHQHQQLNKLRTSSKISRDVIYVNDESIYRTNPRKKNSSISSSGSAASAAAATGVPKSVLAGSSKKGIKFNDDNDVYVQLAVDNNNDNNSDVYETLRTDGNSAGAGAITGAVGGHGGSVGASSSSGGRSSGGGGGNLKPSFDTIDRENIRQWDLMSSGLMKSSISGHIVAGSSGAGSGGSGGSVGGSSSNGGGSGGGNEASTSMGHGGVVVEAANVAASAVKGSLGGVMDSKKMKYIGMEQTGGRLTDEGSSTGTPASISVRNVKNIPKVHLTVKPEPSDPIDTNPFRNMSMNNSTSSNNNINNMNSPFYHHTDNYLGKSAESSTKDIYAQVQKNNAINLQHHHQHSASQLMHTPTDQPWSPSVHKSGSQKELNMLERENVQLMRNLGLSLDMSAGDLLNRTHEELVLLLIQLRRQNSTTARAIEQCCTDIHEVQNRIRTADGPSRAENISRLDSLKQHLAELEKQYEKSKPLVNLVDNMVKLGSLYRGGQGHGRQYPTESVTLDRLEFNQRVQERRLLQEERKHWDRLSPNQTELQTKVQQLYQLDQLLQEESGTLQSLQRDKEDLERALGGLRAKMQNENAPPVAIEAARRQQHALERELSRVHLLLAENSKKLEQTVASNARLEQELLVLRQKLQASRDARGSQSALGSQGDSIPYTAGATAVLESELRRVQQLVGDMQRQRQELSLAVRQLTDNSNSLYQQMNTNGEYSSSHIKKRSQITSWTETDLDSMVSVDHSLMNKSSENLNSSASTTPLYIDTGNGGSMANTSANILNCSSSSKISQNGNNNNYYNYRSQLDSDLGVESSGMESGDDLIESSAFSNLSSQDKQEIKTVRIVKRESERRHRDRERSGTSVSSQNLDQVLEEESSAAHHQYQQYDDYNNYTRTKSLPRTYMETHEIYRQTGTNDSRKEEKQSIYSSNSSIPNNNNNVNINNNNTKYSDYYASQSANTNHYPVSMIDRKADLYTDYCNNSNGSMSNGDGKTVYNNYVNGSGPGLKQKTESIQSLTKTIGELSPVFQSEAAKQIIIEISGNTSEENEKIPLASKQRRAVPKEKRRHFTAPHHLSAKSMQILQTENDMNKNNINWRARDDLDMEVALRPRINAPDVVRSALGPREKISENTIDKLFGAPNKILIPERYVPEQPPELSPEEKKRRQEKVEVIKKMLSETPTIAGNDSASVPPTRAEKKQREHLLQLNQILAQQVMQMSKIVAEQNLDDADFEEKAMAVLPSKVAEFNEIISEDDDQSSPGEPLPLYQQRDNYFT